MKYFPGSAKGIITTFRSKHFNNSYSYSRNCFFMRKAFQIYYISKLFVHFSDISGRIHILCFFVNKFIPYGTKAVVAKTKQMKKRCWPSFLNQTMEKVILEKLLDFPTILSQLLFLRRKTLKEEGRR